MNLPLSISEEEVLEFIKVSESKKHYIWTASRVLQMTGNIRREETPPDITQKNLHNIKSILLSLEESGHLQKRPQPQSIGFGDEIGFEYIG